MGRKRKSGDNASAQAFATMLEANEECMGEMAAMFVMCEQFGISEDEGYDLLISLSHEGD